jgi:hypothetical protein
MIGILMLEFHGVAHYINKLQVPISRYTQGEKRMEWKDIPSNGEVDGVAVNVFFLFQLLSMRTSTLLASVFIFASRP